jgi:hypothetical protein
MSAAPAGGAVTANPPVTSTVESRTVVARRTEGLLVIGERVSGAAGAIG